MSDQEKEERTFLKLYYDVWEEVQPVLPPSELSVFLSIYREIIGYEKYHKTQASLSLSDLQKKTGLSRPTVTKAVKNLVQRGFIEILDAVGRWGMHIFRLARRFLTGAEDSSKETFLVQPPLPTTSKESSLVVVKKLASPAQNFTSSGKEPLPAMAADAAPQAVPDGGKETKETLKETSKESDVLIEKGKEEEEEEHYRAHEWEWALEKIEPQISKAQFMGFFKSTKAYLLNEAFIIEVPTEYHAQRIFGFQALIEATLEPLFKHPVKIYVATKDELAQVLAAAPAREPARSSA